MAASVKLANLRTILRRSRHVRGFGGGGERRLAGIGDAAGVRGWGVQLCGDACGERGAAAAADAVRRGKPPAVHAAAQLCGDRRRVLVGEDAADGQRASGHGQCAQIAREHPRRIRVVGHIQYPGRQARAHRRQPLEATCQPHLGQSPGHRRRRHMDARPELLEDGNRRGRIVILGIPAERRRRQILEAPDAAAVAPAGPVPEDIVIDAELLDSGADRRREVGEHCRHAAAAEYGGAAATEYPGLFACDGIQGGAEELLMVQADADNHGDVGIYRIDRIEAPAHADFEHPGIQPRRLEDQQRRQGVVLEERQADVTARALDPLECRQQFCRVDESPGDADAFAVIAQVRRGEGTDPQARRRHNRPAMGGHGTLAVGAGDADHRSGRLVPVQPLEHRRDPFQAEIDDLRMQRRLVSHPFFETTQRHSPGIRRRRVLCRSAGAESRRCDRAIRADR